MTPQSTVAASVPRPQPRPSLAPEPTTAATPRLQSSLDLALDVAYLSIRAAHASPFDHAKRMHASTASAAVRLVQSLSDLERARPSA